MRQSATETLREQLLLETLRNAFKAQFYRDRKIGSAIQDPVEALHSLPTMSKSDLVSRRKDLLTSREFPARLGITSGTTFFTSDATAIPYTVQSTAEQKAFSELQHILRPRAERSPLTLSIISAMHGPSLVSSAPGVFEVPLQRPFQLQFVKELLETDFDYKGFTTGIEVIIGSLKTIQFLSSVIRKDPGRFPIGRVTHVHTFGDILTPRWRGIIEDTFAASVVDNFGVSELPGSLCPECKVCGGYHAAPIVYPETLGLNSDDPVNEGDLGELVLTPLFPFSSLQPLLRYRTGDIVRRLQQCSLIDDLGFKFVGRRTLSIFRGDELLVPSKLIFEAIDECSDVNRAVDPGLKDFGISDPYGPPRFTLNSPGDSLGVLIIHVEVTYTPFHFLAQAESLKLRIIHSINTGLHEAGIPSRIPINVNILPPGALGVVDRAK